MVRLAVRGNDLSCAVQGYVAVECSKAVNLQSQKRRSSLAGSRTTANMLVDLLLFFFFCFMLLARFLQEVVQKRVSLTYLTYCNPHSLQDAQNRP